MIPPIKQSIVTPIESLALSVRDVFHSYPTTRTAHLAAESKFRQVVLENKLTRGEAVALSQIATAMIKGEDWKK